MAWSAGLRLEIEELFRRLSVPPRLHDGLHIAHDPQRARDKEDKRRLRMMGDPEYAKRRRAQVRAAGARRRLKKNEMGA